MQYCKLCGTELPIGAHFCGRCGRIVSTALEEPADISRTSPTSFTTISDPLPFDQGNDGGNQDVRLNNEDEERRRLLGLPLLGVLASEGQATVANVAEVQGTPQVGGVARVEGGTAPQHIHGSTLHPHATSPQTSAPQHIHSSPAHLYQDVSSALHPRATSPQATAPQAIGHRRAHWHAGARTVRGGWVTITVTTVVIIAGVVSALAFLLPASLSLSGSGTVNSGGTLHVHGAGFLPGSRVTLTLDNGLPLTVVAPGASAEAYGAGSVDASMLQVLAADQLTSSGQTVQVNVSGSFDVTIAVSPSWSAGAHTIRATEYFSALDVQSAALTFTIEPKPAQLVVTPAGLDFGMLKQGSKATKTVTVSNTGQQPLSWEANVGTANWLTLDSSAGTIQPGASQTIQVTAGTTKLSAGHYAATLAISTGSQSMQVAVTLGVTVLQTPLPAQCPPGQVGSPPNCQQPPPPQCPSGTIGTPPNCQQPPPQQCPSGTIGTPPNCQQPPPQQCDPGLAGSPPNCYPCPSGTELQGHHCLDVAPPTCPAGYYGTPPNCQQPPPQQCPSGTYGTWPNCQQPPPICQQGTELRGGVCVPICQEGTKLVDGQCVPICQQGTEFRGGQCVPICQQGTELRGGVCVPICPEGTKLVDGQCVPICQQGTEFRGGQCVPICQQGTELRGGVCVPICPDGTKLVDGQCVPVCPQGTELRGGQCVDVAPPQCDPGLAGSPPNCYPCPSGTELQGHHCVDVAPPAPPTDYSPPAPPSGPPPGPPPSSGPPPCSSPSDPQCLPPIH
jgi:hypothetical protein